MNTNEDKKPSVLSVLAGIIVGVFVTMAFIQMACLCVLMVRMVFESRS